MPVQSRCLSQDNILCFTCSMGSTRQIVYPIHSRNARRIGRILAHIYRIARCMQRELQRLSFPTVQVGRVSSCDDDCVCSYRFASADREIRRAVRSPPHADACGDVLRFDTWLMALVDGRFRCLAHWWCKIGRRGRKDVDCLGFYVSLQSGALLAKYAQLQRAKARDRH